MDHVFSVLKIQKVMIIFVGLCKYTEDIKK